MKVFVGVIISVVSFLICTGHSAVCVPQYSKFILELVWLFNTQSTGPYHKFSCLMRDGLMFDFLSSITARYPGSRVGIATYGALASRGCYTLHQEMTSNIKAAAKTLKQIEIYIGGESPEVPFLGMSMCMGDPAMKWKTDILDYLGRRLLRVIVLSTDDKSRTPGTKPQATGAASDTCLKNDTPTATGIGKILAEKDTILVVLTDSNNMLIWQGYASDMRKAGASVHVRFFDLNKFDSIVNDVLDGIITDMICQTATTTTSTTTPTLPTTPATILTTTPTIPTTKPTTTAKATAVSIGTAIGDTAGEIVASAAVRIVETRYWLGQEQFDLNLASTEWAAEGKEETEEAERVQHALIY